MKTCITCNKTISEDEVYYKGPMCISCWNRDVYYPRTKERQIRSASKWNRENREKYLENKRKEYLKHRDKYREYSRTNKYKIKWGMTKDEYDSIINHSNKSCAICGFMFNTPSGLKKDQPHIDHDHKTGLIRGALCQACNKGLGDFRDNPNSLFKAIEYLKSNYSSIKKHVYPKSRGGR